MLEQLPGVVPQSLLGKALTYLRGQWPKLIRYIENGDWPIRTIPAKIPFARSAWDAKAPVCRYS